MKYVDHVLSDQEIKDIKKSYGFYVKITADVEKELLVIGCELHADGEKVLLEKGSSQEDIWGGGINLETKEIDTTAVLNLRPRLQNNSLEILDPVRREKFANCVKKIFAKLWQS